MTDQRTDQHRPCFWKEADILRTSCRHPSQAVPIRISRSRVQLTGIPAGILNADNALKVTFIQQQIYGFCLGICHRESLPTCIIPQEYYNGTESKDQEKTRYLTGLRARNLTIVLSSQQPKKQLLVSTYQTADDDAIVKIRKKGFQEMAKCGKSLETPYFKPISVLFYLFRDRRHTVSTCSEP